MLEFLDAAEMPSGYHRDVFRCIADGPLGGCTC
jgi:hypothetical protein